MKTSAKFVKILQQVKPSTASRFFTDLLLDSPKRSPRFSSSYEGTENMFYFLNKKRFSFSFDWTPDWILGIPLTGLWSFSLDSEFL